MLNSVLYDHLRDVSKLPFVGEANANIKIIAPSPTHADRIRNLLHEDRKSSVDVMTVAKFIRDHYGNYHKKADLMVKLAAVWQSLLPDSSYEEYMRAFNLFTELRGFTLDKTLVLDILEDFDDQSKLAVLLLWSQFDELGYDDEQGAYFAISEKFLDFDYESVKDDVYIFWGFQFLSGTQVDLIQNIATKHEVYIPVPKYVYDKASDFDWVKWVQFQNQIEIESTVEPKTGKLIRFPKNYLNQYLASFSNVENRDIYLAQRNLTINEIMEVPASDLRFRSSIDILQSKIISYVKWLEEYRGKTRDEFAADLDDKLNESVKDSKFQDLKTLLLIKKAFLQVVESSENDEFSIFDEKLVKVIVRLNSPRNFFVPLVTGDESGEIAQLNSTFYGLNKNNIVIGHSQYSSLYQHFEAFSIDTQKKLATIAPVKRADFELLYIKDNVRSLAKNGLHLFLESGLEVSDVGWAEILEEQNFEVLPTTPAEISGALESDLNSTPIKHTLKSVSATKLQSYLDCSLRFYYQYIDKKSPFIELESFVSPREKGVLQHKVIELYCGKESELDDIKLKELVIKVLNEHLAKNNKQIATSEYQTSLFEIMNYSRHGIEFIFKLTETTAPLSVKYEQPLQNQHESDVKIDGSVDCVVEMENEIVILDFKRSKYSVPSKSEIEKLQKIQLWFYANHGRFNKPVTAIGYVNLAEPELSHLYCLGENTSHAFVDVIKSSAIKSELLDDYKNLEKSCIEKIQQGIFRPLPLKKDSCQFCFLNKVCEKNG